MKERSTIRERVVRRLLAAAAISTCIVACRDPATPHHHSGSSQATPARATDIDAGSLAPAAPLGDPRCLVSSAHCTFEETDRALGPMRSVPLSPDEVRTISYWLEAGGGHGGVYDAQCSITDRCTTLCRAEIMHIEPSELAAVAAAKPSFTVSRAQLARWENAVEPPTPPTPLEPPSLTLRAGPVKVGPGRAEMFLAFERLDCTPGTTSPGGIGGSLSRAPSTPIRAKPPRLPSALACPLPPGTKVDRAVALVEVSLDASGAVKSVLIHHDPGHSLGRAARSCVASASFEPARNERGEAVEAKLNLTVIFNR